MEYGFETGRFYKYPHMPIQIFWFDRDEWMILVAAYLCSMQLGGISWLVLFPASILTIRLKRTQGRGFFRHTLIEYGLVDLHGYPNSSAKHFEE
ncbi:hypothetical protein F4826_004737 [Rahnella inusitata]|jgi:hypothetical protein|nr:hypothetical protein [Rahnella inusitata]